MIHASGGGGQWAPGGPQGRPVCLNDCDAYAWAVDWSKIPEPMRSRLQEQLSQLPPEVRAGLEQKLAKLPLNQLEVVFKRTGPMLERLAGKGGGGGGGTHKTVAGKTSTASKPGSTTGQAPHAPRVFDPHDHYNNTVGRGDSASPPLLVIMFLVACAVVFIKSLDWFS